MSQTQQKRQPIDNSFSIKARYEKSQKLAEVLRELPNFTPAMVMTLTDEQWAMVAEMAGCNPPNSEATKKTIKLILERGF